MLNRIWLSVVCGLSLAGLPGLASSQPNIVVIMADDLSVPAFDTLIGHNWLPYISQELVESGVVFRNAFVTNSACCPSRATFLTGQYSHNHGVYSNLGPTPFVSGIAWDGWLSDSESPGTEAIALPTWLQAAGYHTSHIGKYLNGYGVVAPEGVPDPGRTSRPAGIIGRD